MSDSDWTGQKVWWPGGMPWSIDETAAPELAELGFELSWGQRELLTLAEQRDDDGKLLCFEVFVRGDRQSGKTTAMEYLMLWHLVFGTGRRIVYTAESSRVVRSTFRSLLQKIETLDSSKFIENVRHANDAQEIVGWNDTSITFISRSARGGVRGLTADTLIFDGADRLTDEDLSAALPALAPRKDPQVFYMAPDFTKGTLGRRTKLSEIDPPSPSAARPASWEERREYGLTRVGEVDMGQLDTPLAREMRARFPEAMAR